MTTATDNTVLEITRIFEASPARVFKAWLNREEWQSWIGPEGKSCEVSLLEPHVGGRYRLIMNLSDDSVIPVSGIFKLIEPNKRLVFTWGWEGDDTRQSLITVTFKDRHGKTELTLRQEGLGSVENRDAHGKGWNGTLNKLVAYLASSAVSVGMARMVVIYKTPKDVAAFDKHYFGTHVPLAKQLPGLRKYEVSEGPIVTPAGAAGFHLIATLYFDNLAAINAAFASPCGQACASDRRSFAPGDEDVQMFLYDGREV